MESRSRPDGITAIATADFLLGGFLILLSIVNLVFAPLNILALVLGLFLVGAGWGTWKGMSWAWYLLTFGGGFFGWYFAKNDVKGFFGIEDAHDEAQYSGD